MISEDALNVRSRTLIFLAWLAFLFALSWTSLRSIINASLENGYSSHVILIPFVTAYLIWSGRKSIFSSPRSSLRVGLTIAAAGALVFFSAAKIASIARVVNPAAGEMLGILAMVAGGFVALYGAKAFRSAIFPFCLLLLMLPVPGRVIERIVYFLQAQSAELSYRCFVIIGVPVYREGLRLHLPGVTIEVAKECSGINSSVALLITMLLVACETLRTTSRRLILVLLAVPLSLVKNAVRIVTLTLLSVYVDPSFLSGRLHHQGGFVFYLIALAIMYPVWKLLQTTDHGKLEGKHGPQAPTRSLSQQGVR